MSTETAFMIVLDKVRDTYAPFILASESSSGSRCLESAGNTLITGISQDAAISAAAFLCLASKYMDIETSSHLMRISRYSEAIAEEIGLSPEKMNAIRDATSFHDIGKLWIPDSTLVKPGKLTPVERAVMENHTVYGAEIMANIHSPLCDQGSLVALTHHETWDGTGYPNGLRGEEIPLAGRITALADVFDALTTERPYKRAWEPGEALAVIRMERGTRFDPHIVECFTGAFDKVLDIYGSDKDHGRS